MKTLILMAIASITLSDLSFGQDSTVLRDKWGKKISYRSYSTGDSSYFHVMFKVRSKLSDFGWNADSADSSRWDEFARCTIDDYSNVLGIRGDQVGFWYKIRDTSRNQLIFHQFYGRFPVYGTEIRITTSRIGIRDIYAKVSQFDSCDTLVTVSRDRALEIARGLPQSGSLEFHEPALTILPLAKKQLRGTFLAWKVAAKSHMPAAHFIDARSGAVLHTKYVVE